MPSESLNAESRWRHLYPFVSRETRIGGERWHYIDECTSADPNADVLLFVHGNPSWSFHWRQMIVALRSEYRCVAIDHLGCGLSAAPRRSFRLIDRIAHCVEFVEQLELQNVTLVAQDWGGAIGLGAVLDRRDRFRRAVLFNTGAFRPWFIPWRIRICRTPVAGRAAIQGGNLFCRAALHWTLARRKLSPDESSGCLAPYATWHSRRAVYDFVEDIPLSSRHPTWSTLGQIEDRLPELAEMPIALIWGMRDWCFTPACLEKFVALLPNANVWRIPDAGHWVVEDAPETVNEYVRKFLASTRSDDC